MVRVTVVNVERPVGVPRRYGIDHRRRAGLFLAGCELRGDRQGAS